MANHYRQMQPRNPMQPVQRKNRLWLLIVPPLLSFALVSIIKPTGRFAIWIELSIFCLCSLACGFGLAFRQFKNFKHRIFGGTILSASSLYLISCVIFLGCLPLPQPRLSRTQIQKNRHEEEIRRRAWAAKQIPPRDAEADASMLDLSPFYDGILPETTSGETFFRALKPGTHAWDGIKFDARGTVGTSWWIETNDIPVGKKCSEVDFLHGVQWGKTFQLAGRFIVHFENGHIETIPIIYGADVSNCHFSNKMIPTNAVVWEEMISTNAPPQPFFGLFIKRWNNPFPDETITSIDFAPQPSAFLVAITIQRIKDQNQ